MDRNRDRESDSESEFNVCFHMENYRLIVPWASYTEYAIWKMLQFA